jgi:spore coat protein H
MGTKYKGKIMNKYLKTVLVIVVLSCMYISNLSTATASTGGYPLTDNREIYQQDNLNGDVTHLYITVLKKKSKKKEHIVTFKEVNAYRPNSGKKKVSANIIIQEGTKEGPLNIYTGKGKIEVRGTAAAEATQKSYKISLSKKTNPWEGLKVINLNKHNWDLTRVRNKLSFDLFRAIPDYTSLRTRFVVLHIKDMTANIADYQFHDYGLFTMIEQADKSFLKVHKLDPDGVLYKAENFEFYRYAEQLKNVKDPGYDVKQFQQVLEIKSAKDHGKLLRMLDDVNNEKLSIDAVVAKHFNLDNLLTWLAVNLLLGNIDANAQDFFLYSPSHSDLWYFLPWDYDGAWNIYEQTDCVFPIPKYRKGLSNYWGMVLINRMFREPHYLEALKDKVASLSKLVTKQRVQTLLNKYYPIVSEMVRRNPDVSELPAKVSAFNIEYRRLADIPEENRQAFYKNLSIPMPFFLGEPELRNKKYTFVWDASYSLLKEPLTYQFQLSQSPQFSSVLIQKDLKGIEITINNPGKGTYYWRVMVHDSKGNSQLAFDTYEDGKGKSYFGVKKFSIQ